MNSTKPKIKIIEVKNTKNTNYEENRIPRTERKAIATTKLKPYENTDNYDELSVSYEENNTILHIPQLHK